jgi:hypothetical protein
MDVSDTILGAVIAAAGVVVGGALNIVSLYFLDNKKQMAESRRVALAFRGEISALLALIQIRRYIDRFQLIIDAIEQTGQPHIVYIQVRRNYFPVFSSNVGNLGLLKNPLPELIAQFYTQLNSILEDLESYRDGSLNDLETSDLLASKKETLELFKNTLAIGEAIISKTNQFYSSY